LFLRTWPWPSLLVNISVVVAKIFRTPKVSYGGPIAMAPVTFPMTRDLPEAVSR